VAKSEPARRAERRLNNGLEEALVLLREARQLDDADTEVLLNMADLLMRLKEDPAELQQVLLTLRQILQFPDNDLERAHLAHTTYMLGASREPVDRDALESAAEMFRSLGRFDMVRQCERLLAGSKPAPKPRRAAEPEAKESKAPAGPKPKRTRAPRQPAATKPAPQASREPAKRPPSEPAKQPQADAPESGGDVLGALGKRLMDKLGLGQVTDLSDIYLPTSGNQPPAVPSAGFNPAGTWNVQVMDQLRSTINVTFNPDGSFSGTQTAVSAGIFIQFQGTWAYTPFNRMLQMQGMNSLFAPFYLGLIVQGQQGNAYHAIGTDSIAYVLTRA
jgi:hypothetical protein